jgi:hypothetical protein
MAKTDRWFPARFQPCSALVAQGIERRFPKPCVARSNRAEGTSKTAGQQLRPLGPPWDGKIRFRVSDPAESAHRRTRSAAVPVHVDDNDHHGRENAAVPVHVDGNRSLAHRRVAISPRIRFPARRTCFWHSSRPQASDGVAPTPQDRPLNGNLRIRGHFGPPGLCHRTGSDRSGTTSKSRIASSRRAAASVSSSAKTRPYRSNVSLARLSTRCPNIVCVTRTTHPHGEDDGTADDHPGGRRH